MRTRKSASSKQEWTLLWSKHFEHLKSSHNKDPYRIDIAMDSSSMCEKIRIEFVMEIQEITFENTLDKLSFWYENFGSKTSGENLYNR